MIANVVLLIRLMAVAGALIRAQNKDIGNRRVIRGDLLGVFKDRGWCFRIEPTKSGVIIFRVVGDVLLWCGHDDGLLGLLKGLGEGCLTGARSTAVRTNLGPTFAEKVAKFPACLDC